jgi:glc operon protein GlcG
MTRILHLAAILLSAALSCAASGAPVADRLTLTLDGARQAIDAAVAEAQRLQATGVFAVVDDGGNLIALERLDNTFAAGANISIGKARTAALFKRPTKFFEDVIKNGRSSMIALPDFTPLQGGVPIMIDGQVVGAIGVSGASSAQQDEELATVGASAVGRDAVAPSMTGGDVTSFKSAEVTAAFAKGMPLIETAQFKVHASRREKPGMAEVHTDDTDVIHVLECSATFVTGGQLVRGQTTGAGEIRAAAIEGGETRQLEPGDVIIVPHGTPHWFKDVTGPLLYYVVKVTTGVASSSHAHAGH